MIARYLPRSLNLLTNEIARRQEGKAARRDGGAGRGVKLSLFLVNSLSCIHEHEHLFAELAVLSVFSNTVGTAFGLTHLVENIEPPGDIRDGGREKPRPW